MAPVPGKACFEFGVVGPPPAGPEGLTPPLWTPAPGGPGPGKNPRGKGRSALHRSIAPARQTPRPPISLNNPGTLCRAPENSRDTPQIRRKGAVRSLRRRPAGKRQGHRGEVNARPKKRWPQMQRQGIAPKRRCGNTGCPATAPGNLHSPPSPVVFPPYI